MCDIHVPHSGLKPFFCQTIIQASLFSLRGSKSRFEVLLLYLFLRHSSILRQFFCVHFFGHLVIVYFCTPLAPFVFRCYCTLLAYWHQYVIVVASLLLSVRYFCCSSVDLFLLQFFVEVSSYFWCKKLMVTILVSTKKFTL